MIVLASASPRRRELLLSLGLKFEIYSPDVDETPLENESPNSLCERLSILKAKNAQEKFPNELIIAADTLVIIDDKIFGKPINDDEAFKMLSALNGRRHEVFTGVTVLCGEKELTCVEKTVVQFHKLADDEIREYIATGEPADKAGAYAIQGAGSLIVERVEGDYFNVVGLPLQLLWRMMKKMGVNEKL